MGDDRQRGDEKKGEKKERATLKETAAVAKRAKYPLVSAAAER